MFQADFKFILSSNSNFKVQSDIEKMDFDYDHDRGKMHVYCSER